MYFEVNVRIEQQSFPKLYRIRLVRRISCEFKSYGSLYDFLLSDQLE